MSTVKLALIALLGAAVVGGGVYFYTASKVVAPATTVPAQTEKTEESTNSNAQMEKADTPLSGVGSIRSLFGLGKSVMCDFTYEVSETNGTVAGTIVTDGTRMRGDFEMEQAGVTYKSHMIQSSGKMYTWTVTPQGTFANMFSVDAADTSSKNNDNDNGVSLDQNISYKCTDWSADSSKFVPPTDIDFKDMDGLMKNSASQSTSASGSAGGSIQVQGGNQCGLCVQITDVNSKAECLAAFKCAQ